MMAFDEVDGRQSFNKEHRPLKPRYILRICPNLISLDTGYGESLESGHDEQTDAEMGLGDIDGEVRLAHFSVKTYLTSAEIKNSKASAFSVRESSAHLLMAEVCLTYLLQFNQNVFSLQKVLREFPMAPYAARYWYRHSSITSEDPNWGKVRLLIRKLLNDKEKYFENWCQVSDPDRAQPRIYRRRGNDARGSPLYYASLLGLFEIVEDILEDLEKTKNKTEINAEGGSFGNALQAACAQGNTKVVNLLLAKDAAVNNEGGFFGTALQAACYNGRKDIVDILLSRNANVNANMGNFGTALQAASLQGHKAIVQALLDKNADVNIVGGEYWTSLQAAASQTSSSLGFATDMHMSDAKPMITYANTSQRHRSVCEMLIDRGADVNVSYGGNHGTALEAASYSGSEDIACMHLDKHADVNGRAGDLHNPLQTAAYRGHREIVYILLSRGARINDGVGVHGNALQAASFRNHVSIVNRLLEWNPPASIDSKSRDGETALHWAAMFGDLDLAKSLLRNDSDPNRASRATEMDDHGWTPALLSWIYQRGSDIQKLLLEAAGLSSWTSFGSPPSRLIKALDCSGMSVGPDGWTANLGETCNSSLR